MLVPTRLLPQDREGAGHAVAGGSGSSPTTSEKMQTANISPA
jgi:hypothetical protein